MEAAASAGAEFRIPLGEGGDYEGCEGEGGGEKMKCVLRKGAVGIKEKVKSCEIDWFGVDTPSCVRCHDIRHCGRSWVPNQVLPRNTNLCYKYHTVFDWAVSGLNEDYSRSLPFFVYSPISNLEYSIGSVRLSAL